MNDHWTKQRKIWIEGVSPFHKQELRIKYQFAWILALVFGSKMPHEKA